MILCSLLIFIVAIALSLINQNIRTILYVRVTSIIFIYAGALAFNALYIQSIGSGMGIYSGLLSPETTFFSLNDKDILLIQSSFFFNNKNYPKTMRIRVWNSIKDGWNIPVLPDHISKLENRIDIKIFKIMGGISVFIIVSGIGTNLDKVYFYPIFVISITYIFYRIIISFYALKQWVFNIKSGKFIVRNSPLDMLSSVLKGGVSSIKTVGRFTVGTGMTFALCYELDEILKEEGKNPYFVPAMRTVVRNAGLDSYAKSFLDKIGIKDQEVMSEPDKIDNFLNNASDDDKKLFESSTNLKWNDFVKAHETAKDIQKGSISANVSSIIEKDDPFNLRKK
uniref:hypothetical protein n=1 Tax=Cubamyces menziesii TaxID=2136021 RepID=UPI0030010BF7|nr:hypothetical protein [Cubamyces menziesii]